MAHLFINSGTADRLFSALCNTLMHSLWQGILLAAVAGIIIISTRKATSALRYNLLVSALLFFAIGVGVTFVWQYQGSEKAVTPLIQIAHNNAYTTQVNVQPVYIFPAGKQQPLPVTEQLGNYLSNHHNTIVLIWFLIVCARSLQLAFSLYATRRLRRVGVFLIDGAWPQRMKQLADQLGIRQSVALLESALAKVPMVIGHLKPVVLVPIGLLTALSVEEVEAILVHELAHIKRRDYLVNMLQSLVEIVLFFNPAVLWVSRLIKIERENCCDDLAVAQNNNKLGYIRALVSCEEYRASVPAYAIGLPGSKNTLLHRVKRMVNNSNHSLNLFEKTVLAVCLVALGLGVSAFTAREHIAKALKSVVTAIHHDNKVEHKEKAKTAKNDTTTKKHAVPVNDVAALLGKIQQGSALTDTNNNNGRGPLNLLANKMDSMRRSGDDPKWRPFIVNKMDSNLLKNSGNDLKWRSWLLKKMDTNLFARNKGVYKTFHDIGLELSHEHLLTDTSHMNISLNENELIVNGVRMSKELHDRIYKQFGNKGSSGSYSSSYTDNNQRFASDDKTNNIIRDMMKDGIITGTDDLSFKIGTTEFVVNYKKQPEAVYQRYRVKYVPSRQKGDWIWFYHFDTNKWDQMTGRKSSGDINGSATGVFQGKEDANSSGYNSGDYYRQNESQKRYWDGQQRKIIDEIKREGLVNNETVFSFSLGDKRFVINGVVQSDEVFKKYYREYVSANAGHNWDWSYHNRWDAHSDSLRDERNRVEAERDKKLVADLLQDALINDPKNVTFTLSDKKLEINGKKQSEELYNKYKDKYLPNNTGSNWSWTYSHHE